ncbi:hypothetical protein CRENBAI_012036 [Crenichthys baileyi]|uniref:Uncharacterized protein n=1 Tax=Crenichthys baileyi TaxID=28760 RepID=A0AAV9R0F2_9TELE
MTSVGSPMIAAAAEATGEAEKNKYLEESAALKAEGRTQHLSPEMRELKVKKHLKQLKLEVCRALESLWKCREMKQC